MTQPSASNNKTDLDAHVSKGCPVSKKPLQDLPYRGAVGIEAGGDDQFGLFLVVVPINSLGLGLSIFSHFTRRVTSYVHFWTTPFLSLESTCAHILQPGNLGSGCCM